VPFDDDLDERVKVATLCPVMWSSVLVKTLVISEIHGLSLYTNQCGFIYVIRHFMSDLTLHLYVACGGK